MFAHIVAQAGAGLLAGGVGIGGAEGGEGLQREFRVHHHEPVVAGQADDAIGPVAVGEHMLEGEGVGGEIVPHDGLHAALAEGAARLLVGENLLQPQHLLRKAGQPLLGPVDHCETLAQFRQMVGGGTGALLQPLPHPRAHGVEPVGHDAGEIGLAGGHHLGHGAQAAGQFRVEAGQLLHLVVGLVLALGGERRLEGARVARPQDGDRDDDQKGQRQSAGGEQEPEAGDGNAEGEEGLVHRLDNNPD